MKSRIEYLKKGFKANSRPCVHILSDRINAPKLCIFNYECNHCAFDQWLDEVDLDRNRSIAAADYFFDAVPLAA